MNSKQSANLERAFRKYDADQKGYLTKLEFKCAFIFLTGLQPSKQDMQVIRQYMEST
jgi:Ca2+-binding EF-hand superfamily protein